MNQDEIHEILIKVKTGMGVCKLNFNDGFSVTVKVIDVDDLSNLDPCVWIEYDAKISSPSISLISSVVLLEK